MHQPSRRGRRPARAATRGRASRLHRRRQGGELVQHRLLSALASMERATERLCTLAGAADARCTSARTRVKSASGRASGRLVPGVRRPAEGAPSRRGATGNVPDGPRSSQGAPHFARRRRASAAMRARSGRSWLAGNSTSCARTRGQRPPPDPRTSARLASSTAARGLLRGDGAPAGPPARWASRAPSPRRAPSACSAGARRGAGATAESPLETARIPVPPAGSRPWRWSRSAATASSLGREPRPGGGHARPARPASPTSPTAARPIRKRVAPPNERRLPERPGHRTPRDGPRRERGRPPPRPPPRGKLRTRATPPPRRARRPARHAARAKRGRAPLDRH